MQSENCKEYFLFTLKNNNIVYGALAVVLIELFHVCCRAFIKSSHTLRIFFYFPVLHFSLLRRNGISFNETTLKKKNNFIFKSSVLWYVSCSAVWAQCCKQLYTVCWLRIEIQIKSGKFRYTLYK